ncbi:MAG: alpha/beta fold hydrolase, partial [Planctomycetaceae bacterium]|nr:alpha/beta fold hydrolase [Planctomycetaceae bacterium]
EFPLGESRSPRCVVFLHGLAGSASSPYIVRTAKKFRELGYRTIRVNLRGAACDGKFAQRPYHAGCSDDVQFLMEELSRRHPETQFSLVGFSLGGNVVLKWAGEYGDQWTGRVTKIVAANPPIDLAVCSSRIGTVLGGFYDRYFARILYGKVKAVPHWWELSRFCRLGTRPRGIVEFDDAFTAPMNNFASALEYYADASAARVMGRITLPTTIVSAEDDPLVPSSLFRETALSRSIDVHMTRSGGHLAYMGRRGVDPDRYWLDWRIIEWIEQSYDNSGRLLIPSDCDDMLLRAV